MIKVGDLVRVLPYDRIPNRDSHPVFTQDMKKFTNKIFKVKQVAMHSSNIYIGEIDGDYILKNKNGYGHTWRRDWLEKVQTDDIDLYQ